MQVQDTTAGVNASVSPGWRAPGTHPAQVTCHRQQQCDSDHLGSFSSSGRLLILFFLLIAQLFVHVLEHREDLARASTLMLPWNWWRAVRYFSAFAIAAPQPTSNSQQHWLSTCHVLRTPCRCFTRHEPPWKSHTYKQPSYITKQGSSHRHQPSTNLGHHAVGLQMLAAATAKAAANLELLGCGRCSAAAGTLGGDAATAVLVLLLLQPHRHVHVCLVFRVRLHSSIATMHSSIATVHSSIATVH